MTILYVLSKMAISGVIWCHMTPNSRSRPRNEVSKPPSAEAPSAPPLPFFVQRVPGAAVEEDSSDWAARHGRRSPAGPFLVDNRHGDYDDNEEKKLGLWRKYMKIGILNGCILTKTKGIRGLFTIVSHLSLQEASLHRRFRQSPLLCVKSFEPPENSWYPLVNQHNCGKSPFSMGKSTTNVNVPELFLITRGYSLLLAYWSDWKCGIR